jgi:3-hydroxyanthranilate 3,4-dioxygenase
MSLPDIRLPFNLHQWIEENRDLLKPPVNNKNLYLESGDYIIMVVGGPNARKDFHFNESEELFYQLEGDIQVNVQMQGKVVEYKIKEGEIFLLPANIPHNPVRGANTVGLVIERKRTVDMSDGLFWYCESCNHPLKSYRFLLDNIEKDFPPRFKEFYSSEDMRTCEKCGTIMEVDARFA